MKNNKNNNRNSTPSTNPVANFGVLNLYNQANQLASPKRQATIKTGSLMYDRKVQQKVDKSF
tara:strand:- start:5 stop:190 length:186 start_codon:yes stop_codon:yes gene_type:complete